ncbi:TPA: ead/Ea22-like family protein [Yersinia enterocolitica]
MNNIEELKKAANAIGYEKWIDSAGEVTSVDYLAGGDVTCDHICNCEEFNGESANAKFIALANPATILDLIAQLEAAQKERDALKQQITSLFERVSGELIGSYPDNAINWLADMIEGELDTNSSALSAANEKLSKPVILEIANERLRGLTAECADAYRKYNIPLFTASKPAEGSEIAKFIAGVKNIMAQEVAEAIQKEALLIMFDEITPDTETVAMQYESLVKRINCPED